MKTGCRFIKQTGAYSHQQAPVLNGRVPFFTWRLNRHKLVQISHVIFSIKEFVSKLEFDKLAPQAERYLQKQPSRGVLRKGCYENMQQIYRRTCQCVISIRLQSNLICNFIGIALWHGCSPVHLLHILRTPFDKNTSGQLFLYLILIVLDSA